MGTDLPPLRFRRVTVLDRLLIRACRLAARRDVLFQMNDPDDPVNNLEVETGGGDCYRPGWMPFHSIRYGTTPVYRLVNLDDPRVTGILVRHDRR